MLGRIGSFLQTGRPSQLSIPSLRKVQVVNHRHFGVYHEGNNPSSIPLDEQSFTAYQWMGINVRKPKDKIGEYLFIIDEQKDACARMLYTLENKTKEQKDAEIMQSLRDRAELIQRAYKRTYTAENTQLIKNNPTESHEVAPTFVNSAVGFLGRNRESQKPAYEIDMSSSGKYKKKLKGQVLFNDTPNFYVEGDEQSAEDTKRVLTPEERREARKERKVSPFMDKLKAHYQITKPRISLMVTTTAWWGYFLSMDTFQFTDFALLSAGTLALSISASIINQFREIDVDSKMYRTIARPLVTGKITPATAKQLAAVYCIAGAALLAPISPVACALGVANVALYGGLYTSMKRTTPLNTEIGAFVGAIPPIMGYFVGLPEGAAWTHDLMALYWPAAVMISWQMQHVMLICMRRAEEYNASGLKMQCFNDPDLISTRTKGISWSIISTAIVSIPYFAGWADISNIISIYLWGVYTAFYAKASLSLPLNQPRLLKILLSGYLLLAITVAISLHGKKREDKKFDYLQVAKKRKPTEVMEATQ